MKRWTVEELARMIDHTYVKADATRKQMEKLCKEAREYHFAMAAINSSQTALCAEYLRTVIFMWSCNRLSAGTDNNRCQGV